MALLLPDGPDQNWNLAWSKLWYPYRLLMRTWLGRLLYYNWDSPNFVTQTTRRLVWVLTYNHLELLYVGIPLIHPILKPCNSMQPKSYLFHPIRHQSSSKGSNLVYLRSSETNWPQTYRWPSIYVGWMRSTLVYNNSLSLSPNNGGSLEIGVVLFCTSGSGVCHIT